MTGTSNYNKNAAALVAGNNDSFGQLNDSMITGDTTNFAFETGQTNAANGIIFNGFTRVVPYIADSATNNVLFPAGSAFDCRLGLHFQQNGVAAAFNVTSKLTYDGTNLNPSDVFALNVGAVQFNNFAKTGSNITSIGAGGPVTGTAVVTCNGVYIP